jgi:activator-of-BECN1-regulated-autophagy protein 1
MTDFLHFDDDDEMSLDWMPRRKNQADDPPVIVPPPSIEEMKERIAFRDEICQQTRQQRRIEPHGGMGGTGRNVMSVLLDRERRGAQYSVKKSSKPQSSRSMTYPTQVWREIQVFSEYCSVTKYHASYLHHLGGKREEEHQSGGERRASAAVSTISVAFSYDSLTMASTHGDHTVKISSCLTGELLKSLEGHPRTPWTVKYHPTNVDIVASGCLGCQVRVWDWKEGTCLRMIRLDHAIISLSFHPSGHVLAIASGSRLHFWDYNNFAGRQDEHGNVNNSTRGALTEVEQRHMLRCVHFPPNGNTLIVGGTNPQTDEQRRRGRSGMSGGGMTFYLRLWDFDLNATLHPEERDARDVRNLGRASLRMHRKALSNPRTFVPRALLYNDGGFDVSPDGSTLCCCAEYWLPEGVDSAMELIKREELPEDAIDANEMQIDYEEGSSGAPSTPRRPGTPGQQGNKFGSPDASQVLNSPHNSPPRRSQQPLPMTPPNLSRQRDSLSPPPPPGLRFGGTTGGAARVEPPPSEDGNPLLFTASTVSSRYQAAQRVAHRLCIISGSLEFPDVAQQPGRYVPHVVTVGLDTSPIIGDSSPTQQYRGSVARGHRPRLGQLLEAAPLEGSKATAVTCVKFSPSADFCLLGFGVREPAEGDERHPVTALYRIRGGMKHISTMLSGDDDVNIARFHPDSGYGFVYGTKQGRVRVLSPRPWNYYNC